MTVTAPERDGTRAVAATHRVTAGMCGHNSLLAGRLGDWSWDLVSRACDVDVLTASNAEGEPTYLSFCYYRIVGSRRFHLRSPRFGDRLAVRSAVFGMTSESVVVLHELRRGPAPDGEIDPDGFFAFDDPDCLYVEHYNRWISRASAESNRAMVSAAPVGFRHAHLPRLPVALSPRLPFRRALTTGTARPERGEHVGTCRVGYAVDPTRDLNGAGLLYFASYFSIVDRALLAMSELLGWSTQRFLDRVVVDQQLCLLGNADADTTFELEIGWGPVRDAIRRVDVTVTEHGSGRPIAVCALDIEEEQV